MTDKGRAEALQKECEFLKDKLNKADKNLSEATQRLEAAVCHSEHVEVERDKFEIELQDVKIQLEYYKGFSDAVKLICGGGGV